jgi:hypothetical protein
MCDIQEEIMLNIGFRHYFKNLIPIANNVLLMENVRLD